MTPTIKDVAKKANVSIATVSRILNNKPGFTPETKLKVLKVIEEIGYQPNGMARGLINKKTQTIGVIFPNVSNMYSAEVLSGIEDAAHEDGSSVIVCKTDSSMERTMKYLRVLAEKRVDGIVFASEMIKEPFYKFMQDVKIPVVLLSSISYQYPIPYVKVDDRHAAYTATIYLIEQGHKKIAMICGDRNDLIAGIPRVEGYKEALQHSGISVIEDYIINANGFAYHNGQEAMDEILVKKLDVTAIFASSDEMALGVLTTAHQKGIKIPDDFSVMGYDDLKLAQMSIPQLTTVAQPLYNMGKSAASMLFEMIATGEQVQSRIMPHSIIKRDSVKERL
ncbi:LacI family DNA-binding transcriptional regulator [Metabacillus herbersteinensis]|uniref:LacI family DNA-binding transcriptional regulator n=1 Tax=Metabacillus herbersteinensis TaxID=283816 RepID=A0ABV6GF33_9BACI